MQLIHLRSQLRESLSRKLKRKKSNVDQIPIKLYQALHQKQYLSKKRYFKDKRVKIASTSTTSIIKMHKASLGLMRNYRFPQNPTFLLIDQTKMAVAFL